MKKPNDIFPRSNLVELQQEKDLIRRNVQFVIDIQDTKKDIKELRDKEFVIEGYPQIFTTKVDYKVVFQMWGLVPPLRITKKAKIDILTKTRNKHDVSSLNYKYWDYLLTYIT
ncbi:MAG: hypothetical protein ACRC6E_06755 [Fusobacteriaceae bacterium]